MSVAELKIDFPLKLKKIYGSKVKYELKLCCPIMVDLENDCPRRLVAFKIPHCFVNDGTLYTVENVDEIKMKYTNMTSLDSKEAVCIKRDNCCFIIVLTDDVLKVNELCINEVCIPVVPTCFDSSLINSTIKISSVATLECYESNCLRDSLVTLFQESDSAYDEDNTDETHFTNIDNSCVPTNDCKDKTRKAIWDKFIDHVNKLFAADSTPKNIDEILKDLVLSEDEEALIVSILECSEVE
jgi:hypothetical protein